MFVSRRRHHCRRLHSSSFFPFYFFPSFFVDFLFPFFLSLLLFFLYFMPLVLVGLCLLFIIQVKSCLRRAVCGEDVSILLPGQHTTSPSMLVCSGVTRRRFKLTGRTVVVAAGGCCIGLLLPPAHYKPAVANEGWYKASSSITGFNAMCSTLCHAHTSPDHSHCLSICCLV